MAPEAKGPEDFSTGEAKKIRDELAALTTGDARNAVYTKHKTSKQRFIKVMSAHKLEALPPTKSSKKSKAPAKATSGKAPAAKATSRKVKPVAKTPASAAPVAASPAKTTPSKPPQRAAASQPSKATPSGTTAGRSGVSPETKELIARALLKLLED